MIIDKFREVMAEADAEKGGIVLFAVFEREEPSGKLDIIFSASWIERIEDEIPAANYLLSKIRSRLVGSEFIAFARVITLPPSEELVTFVLDRLRTATDRTHLGRFVFNGIAIARADILAADLSYGSLPAVADAEAMRRQADENLAAIASR